MKILIIQSDGQHKGQDGWTPNWYLRECYAIQYAFQKNGHEADIWGLRHENFSQRLDFSKYDIIFCIENYETDWLPKFPDIKGPLKIQWIIDLQYRGNEAFAPISKGFDIIVNSTRCLMAGYNKYLAKNQKHIWFPNGVDDRYFTKTDEIEKKNDIIFVGSDGINRIHFINQLVNDPKIKMKKIFATGIDMINLIKSTKIHFNKNDMVDINYRTFETIGLGTCLVTNWDKDLEPLGFIDGNNCLLYKDINECKNKILLSLKTESWKEIAKNGYELSKQNTYTKRIEKLLKEI